MTYETISNEQFLKAVFGAQYDRAWVCGFREDPNAQAPWYGGEYGSGFGGQAAKVQDTNNNTFVAISTFKTDPEKKKPRRLNHLFDKCYLIVLDDIGSGLGSKVHPEDLPVVLRTSLRPSYIIETSPANMQYGYIIEGGDSRAWAVDQVYKWLIDKGLSDPGTQGVARYVRCPVGCNTKAKYKTLGDYPAHHMSFWNPERTYTLDALAKGLGIPLKVPQDTESGQVARKDHQFISIEGFGDDPVLKALDTWGLVKGPKTSMPGAYHVTCPWVHEHTDEIDDGAMYFCPGTQMNDGTTSLHGGFCCKHSHGDKYSLRNVKQELERLERESQSEPWAVKEKLPTEEKNPLDRFRIKDWAHSKPRPRTWLLEDSFMLGCEGLLFGDGGSGKSRLAYQAAIGVASGTPIAGVFQTPNPGAVLYICPEDDREEMHRRFEEIMAVVNSDVVGESCIDKARLYENLYIERGIMPDGENRLTCFDQGDLRESEAVNYLIMIASKIKELRLIILDPLASFMAGDENSTECMTQLIKALRTVSQALGHEVNVLVVHHSNKAGGTGSQGQHGARGSSALTCGVRWVSGLFGMTEIEAKIHGIAADDRWQYVRWGLVKTNYSPGQGVIWLRRTGEGGVLLKVVLGITGEARGVEDPAVLGQVCRILTQDRDLDVFHSATGFAEQYAKELGVGQKRLKRLIDQGVEARVLTLLRSEARGPGPAKLVHVAAWYNEDS